MKKSLYRLFILKNLTTKLSTTNAIFSPSDWPKLKKVNRIPCCPGSVTEPSFRGVLPTEHSGSRVGLHRPKFQCAHTCLHPPGKRTRVCKETHVENLLPAMLLGVQLEKQPKRNRQEALTDLGFVSAVRYPQPWRRNVN